jgi:pimeloyl-ACP methyl ester carboxylesterase
VVSKRIVVCQTRRTKVNRSSTPLLPPLGFVENAYRTPSGTRDFWRKGLELAWGDPDRLSDSDVLRFQWPSIGEGWEQGVINFFRSRILSSPPPDSLDDGRLFREVARRADTRVVIIYGSKDRVVRIDHSAAEVLRRRFPNVRVIVMEGCGHDPFEEDVPGFLMVFLERALEG